MRHRFSLVITTCFLILLFPLQVFAVPPSLSATSAILVEKETGFVLYELNAERKLSVASTTKMITGILVLEYGNLKDKVVTSQEAADAGGSELYLSPGEERTVEELVYSLLLRSANDAAVVLAEYIAGSVEEFANLMNRKANLIGANSTEFVNPHGLHDENFSTAYDLSLIARYCLGNEDFTKIVATQKRTIPWPDNPYPRELENHNKLLLKYPKATGIKTGYTKKAGYCLVSSAKEGELTLIAVVLNCPSSDACYNDSINLLEYGFKNFKNKKIVNKGRTYKEVKVPFWEEKLELIAKEDCVISYNGDKGEPKLVIKTVSSKELPIEKGEKLGEIIVAQGDLRLGQVELIAKKGVPKPTLWQHFIHFLSRIFKSGEN